MRSMMEGATAYTESWAAPSTALRSVPSPAGAGEDRRLPNRVLSRQNPFSPPWEKVPEGRMRGFSARPKILVHPHAIAPSTQFRLTQPPQNLW